MIVRVENPENVVLVSPWLVIHQFAYLASVI